MANGPGSNLDVNIRLVDDFSQPFKELVKRTKRMMQLTTGGGSNKGVQEAAKNNQKLLQSYAEVAVGANAAQTSINSALNTRSNNAARKEIDATAKSTQNLANQTRAQRKETKELRKDYQKVYTAPKSKSALITQAESGFGWTVGKDGFSKQQKNNLGFYRQVQSQLKDRKSPQYQLAKALQNYVSAPNKAEFLRQDAKKGGQATKLLTDAFKNDAGMKGMTNSPFVRSLMSETIGKGVIRSSTRETLRDLYTKGGFQHDEKLMGKLPADLTKQTTALQRAAKWIEDPRKYYKYDHKRVTRGHPSADPVAAKTDEGRAVRSAILSKISDEQYKDIRKKIGNDPKTRQALDTIRSLHAGGLNKVMDPKGTFSAKMGKMTQDLARTGKYSTKDHVNVTDIRKKEKNVATELAKAEQNLLKSRKALLENLRNIKNQKQTQQQKKDQQRVAGEIAQHLPKHLRDTRQMVQTPAMQRRGIAPVDTRAAEASNLIRRRKMGREEWKAHSREMRSRAGRDAGRESFVSGLTNRSMTRAEWKSQQREQRLQNRTEAQNKARDERKAIAREQQRGYNAYNARFANAQGLVGLQNQAAYLRQVGSAVAPQRAPQTVQAERSMIARLASAFNPLVSKIPIVGKTLDRLTSSSSKSSNTIDKFTAAVNKAQKAQEKAAKLQKTKRLRWEGMLETTDLHCQPLRCRCRCLHNRLRICIKILLET